jgi:uncharacterized protein (TIGR04255 family)
MGRSAARKAPDVSESERSAPSTESDRRSLPEYENPPVVEVVCGVSFASIQQFTIPYLGLFWKELGDDFTSCQEVQPLTTVLEQSDGTTQVEISLGPLPTFVPRVWFLHRAGDQIVQIQRDRFLCNWRKTDQKHAYPRYGWVIGQFNDRLALFERFLRQHWRVQVPHRQYELSYINHIPAHAAWQTLADLGSVLPDLAWRVAEARFLPNPEVVDVQLSFRLPSGGGRLHVRAHSGARLEDKIPVLVLELTARGFGVDRPRWFDLAHEWIVRGFADLTGESVQRNVWRRRP